VTLENMTTAELLDAWRDASRAADLAERLAELARRAAEKGEQDAISAQEIAALAARRVRGSPSDRSCV